MAVSPEVNSGPGYAWRPGITRHVPWIAFLCMAGFALCCIGLGLVLSESDGKEVDTWPDASRTVSVPVLLSLLVSIANVCLAGALGKAYEVAWWLKAIRGAELQRLQFDLNVQQDLSALASRSLAVNEFAIAAVLALGVGLADGPLIQKASTSVPRTHPPAAGTVQAQVVDGNLPPDFSSFGNDLDTLTPVFANISHAYANRDPIALVLAACAGNTTCAFDLPGPGFDVSCSTSSAAYDFGELNALNPTVTTFNVTMDYATQGSANASDSFYTIHTSATWKPDSACAGELQTRTCALRIGTITYPLTVSNGTATLAGWDPARNDTLSLLSVLAEPDNVLFNGTVGGGNLFTMLGGVYSVASALYASTVTLEDETTDEIPYILRQTGQAGSNYLTTPALSDYGNCTMTWSDPTADLVNTVRELMLRSVLAYAAQSPANATQQALAAQLTRTSVPTYQSTYRYLGATLALMGAEALLILWLLAGWRRLGRTVSLDPFEIARALGAPLLQPAGSSTNSGIDAALLPIRRTRLRYGEILPAGAVPADGTVVPAGVSAADAAAQPATGSKEGGYALVNGDDELGQQRPRLGLVPADRAGPIRTGVLY